MTGGSEKGLVIYSEKNQCSAETEFNNLSNTYQCVVNKKSSGLIITLIMRLEPESGEEERLFYHLLAHIPYMTYTLLMELYVIYTTKSLKYLIDSVQPNTRR